MTATEPEYSLFAAAPDEASAARAPSWIGLVGRALLGSVLAVAIGALLGLAGLEGSYAGARDEAVAERAISTYGPFLEAVGRNFIEMGISEALGLTPVVLGLLLALRSHPRTAVWVSGRWLLPTLLGLLSVFAFFVSVAHQHPGLFLPILASSRLLTASARWGHWVGVLVFGAAALGYVLTARASGKRRVRLACGGVVLIPAALWLVGWKLEDPARLLRSAALAAEPGSSRRPNILVLAVDSLRPDMIDAAHTPHISRLLAESIYFPNALVTQPRTGPSWAATLTSLSPLSNGVETMFPSEASSHIANFALPAHLASLGYETAVFSEYAGEFFTRADFGFREVRVPKVELREITGQMLMMRMPTLLAATSVLYTQGPLGRAVLGRRLSNLMRGLANFAHPAVLEDDMIALARERASLPERKKAPFFWLAFYSQPHFPYTSSSDFYPHYEVEGASPELRFGRDVATEAPIATPADREQLVGLYRAALAETDAAIGSLLSRLEAERLLEDTIIVLLSDHGEGLYECPTCVGHGDNLRSMVTLRVPLAFRLPASRYPKAKPSRRKSYVSQLDLYPTLLRLLRQEPMPHHQGLPLLHGTGSPARVPARDHFAETGEWLWPTPAVPGDRIRYPVITEMAKLEHGRIVIDPKYSPEIRAAKHRAVIRPPYKLSYEPGSREVQYHLYDFHQDPEETHDLAASQPELVQELKQSLFRSMLRHPQVLSVADYFLTRPEPPPPERY